MADINDVYNALMNSIAAAIYPNGTSSPSAIVVGSTNPSCRVMAGWPIPAALDADITAGIVNISIYAQPGMEHNTTRFPRTWFDQFKTVCSITATLSGNTITIGGTITVGHYVTVLIGTQNAYSYAAKAGDTLSTFAAALAALINVNFPTTASGPVITLPATTGGRIIVRTAAPGTVIQELERTNQMFLVTVWASNNATTAATCAVVRPALAQIDYLNFPDATVGRLLYVSSSDMCNLERASIYRRDIHYSVEYATCITAPGYPLTDFQSQIVVPGDQGPVQYDVNS